MEKEKQALAIFLSLEGKARETVLEVEVDDLNKDDGVEKVLAKLDNLFLKDKLQLAYTSFFIIIINFDYPGQDYAFAWQRVVTDVGLHSECLPHISRQPPLKYKVDLSP